MRRRNAVSETACRLGMMSWNSGRMEAHTQASGSDAFGDLVAESFVEGDVAFLEDAVKEL